MKVKIDYDLCMGDGNCHRTVPEVFDYDEPNMRGMVRDEEVPSDFEAAVREAADQCAPGAIAVEE